MWCGVVLQCGVCSVVSCSVVYVVWCVWCVWYSISLCYFLHTIATASNYIIFFTWRDPLLCRYQSRRIRREVSPLLRVQPPQSYLPVILFRFRLAQFIARATTSSVCHFCHVIIHCAISTTCTHVMWSVPSLCLIKDNAKYILIL